jgi:hypothetical protein
MWGSEFTYTHLANTVEGAVEPGLQVAEQDMDDGSTASAFLPPSWTIG